jgi:hypothetical protein
MRGVQSAIFHYVSCAPCIGFMSRKQRQKQANRERKVLRKLQLEEPDSYYHPEPTGTNPYWGEEIIMGPGPPPRRAKRSNTGSRRGLTTAGTHSTQGDKSLDLDPNADVRLSDDTTDDENWNRKRYQREDEDLWGFGELVSSKKTTVAGSSVGLTGITRPSTSKSSADSYYAVRNPPVNDLHPPVVSLPSPHPSDNRWMLQPPPKAAVMSGKERAKADRSGSGSSSRVELSLQRQVSTKQLQQKIERGETPEMPSMSRGSSYTNLVGGQRHDRPRTPQARPISAASSRRKKRRDTAITRTDAIDRSSGESNETTKRSVTSPKVLALPSINVVRVRGSRQHLSTVISSGSGASPPGLANDNENDHSKNPMQVRRTMTYHASSKESSDFPYMVKHRNPLASSDISSLNVLQDLVSPRALLNSRYVSAPLVEARIKLPPSDFEEESVLSANKDSTWADSGFGLTRDWGTDQMDGQTTHVPFDSSIPLKDPSMRWSVDF